jgi:hypothetical protein
MTARSELYGLTRTWDAQDRLDSRDRRDYQEVLDEILYHADMRFIDYIHGSRDGEFPVRLKKWIENGRSPQHQKTLLRLVEHLLFIDRLQMLSLHRDAFRRAITPWLRSKEEPSQLLSPTSTQPLGYFDNVTSSA